MVSTCLQAGHVLMLFRSQLVASSPVHSQILSHSSIGMTKNAIPHHNFKCQCSENLEPVYLFARQLYSYNRTPVVLPYKVRRLDHGWRSYHPMIEWGECIHDFLVLLSVPQGVPLPRHI